MTQSVTLKGDLLDLGPSTQEDVTLNDSDKSFTVPAGETWELMTVWAQLASTVTVGNRRVAVEAQDAASGVLSRLLAGVTQAASLTQRYNFGVGLADQGTLRSDELTVPLPRLVLAAGETLRVYDLAAVDAAADDLLVRATVVRRGA